MNDTAMLKVSLEHVRTEFKHLLSNRALDLDARLKTSIETLCSNGEVQRIVDAEAKVQLDRAIREEVRDFFSYTVLGRAAIRAEVWNYLEESQKQPTKPIPPKYEPELENSGQSYKLVATDGHLADRNGQTVRLLKVVRKPEDSLFGDGFDLEVLPMAYVVTVDREVVTVYPDELDGPLPEASE